ncbi:MAG: fimbrillin family protein [Muribaculaceae bacterium]|nr:fimbrillin family protein [Muribaculaceae bacterium]
MKAYNPKYIVPLLLPALLAGCADDELLTSGNPAGNPDAITFAAFTVDAVEPERTRGAEKPIYDPLTLSGDSDDSPLYLHTYETNRIGYRPGEETGEATTRGVQVTTGNLAEIHKNFTVVANKSIGGSTYFNWKETHLADVENNVWYTARTEYWPASENLTFHAVSPAVEFDNLSDLSAHEGEITFGYSARKGTADNDAELQHDLLLSSYSCNKQTHTGKVPLDFSHALSAVKFAVRDVLDGEVVNIKIAGVRSSGVCTFKPGEISWENQDGTATYSQNFNYKLTGQEMVDVTDDSKDKVLNEMMPEKTFMLIPQQIPDDAEIIVTLKRDNVSAPAKSEITVKGKIKANGVEEWKPGHEYIYTISTSKDNWVYVFDAKGNAAEGDGNIFMYSPTRTTEFDKYGDNGYFSVNSYRYRANDHSYVEPLPWKASHGGSLSYMVDGSVKKAYPENNPEQKRVTASQWIQDTFTTPLSGKGSKGEDDWEIHNLKVLSHYVSTDWPGDEVMQAYPHYPGNSKANPYDLSTFGGKIARTTANCYVIDRGGWYCFPLVYGSAMVKGVDTKSAYQSSSSTSGVLSTLTDYQNNAISQAYINTSATASAQLIWQDAYNMVTESEIELVTLNNQRMIRFYVNSNDLQQGNAIIALTDKPDGTVIWSWHIWATEHWLDKDTRLPHVFDKSNSSFTTFEEAPKTKIRQRGDVEVTYNQKNRSFMMSPYNLGWCDPKRVIYLQRENEMEFVQYMPDGTALTGKIKKLPIIQEGGIVDYKYGNNTYYQWGRKDPMRGYFNHENDMKRIFGPRPSDIKPQVNITIGDAIQNPNVFYAGKGASGSAYEDWLAKQRPNLWNNNATLGTGAIDEDDNRADFWSHTKTVYDPSPAGYLVPNAGVWRVVQKAWSDSYSTVDGVRSKRDHWAGGNWPLATFKNKINGEVVDEYNYKIWGNGTKGNNNAIYFSSTGNRWWSSEMMLDAGKPTQWTPQAGANFGKNVSYAWSSRYANGNNAYGMALGLDTDREINGGTDADRYYVGGQFIGRRAMARPVRAIRDPNF